MSFNKKSYNAANLALLFYTTMFGCVIHIRQAYLLKPYLLAVNDVCSISKACGSIFNSTFTRQIENYLYDILWLKKKSFFKRRGFYYIKKTRNVENKEEKERLLASWKNIQKGQKQKTFSIRTNF